jgi:hypothetical protein
MLLHLNHCAPINNAMEFYQTQQFLKANLLEDHFMYRNFLLFALFIGVLLGGPVNATLYRWVDDTGHVQFTDKIPPSAVNRGREILNNDGMATQVIERAKTKEEFERDQEVERLRAEQKKILAKQQAADQVLLRTFRSEDDMILARNGKLEAIGVGVYVAQGSVRRFQTKLTELQRKAANLELSKAGSTEQHANLDKEIKDTLKRINDTYQLIRTKEQDQQVIRDTYDRDIRRFRVLKRLSPDQQVVEEHKIKPLDNLLPCGDAASCDRAWAQAEVFVRKYATTPMQMLADSIIMTAAPKRESDISITISRIHDQGDEGKTYLFMDLFCKDTPLGKELCASPKVSKIRQSYRQEVGRPAA